MSRKSTWGQLQLWNTATSLASIWSARSLVVWSSRSLADPLIASLPTASAIACKQICAVLLASANHPGSIGKAASDSLPVVPAPSIAGSPFPFAAALVGRRVKIERPKPSKFSCIAVDSDICAWLLRMHQYLTILAFEPKAWVVFASNFLDKL